MKRFISILITGIFALGLCLSLSFTPESAGAAGICDTPENDGVVWYSGGPKTKAGWLEKGDSYEGVIEACNDNVNAQIINIYTTPYSISQNDFSGADFISQNSWNKLAEWISFPDGESYIIQSGETIFIDFKIDVPNDGTVISGSQASSIMLEGAEVFGESEENSVLSTKRFAWLVFADINGDGLRWGGNTYEWNTNGPIVLDNKDGIKTGLIIENSGNVNFDVKSHVAISDAFKNDKVIFEKDSEMTVFPESKRANEVKWEEAPALGLFNVTETVSYLDKNETFTKTILMFPLWLLLIIAVIIVLLIVALVLKIRNSKSKKQVKKD